MDGGRGKSGTYVRFGLRNVDFRCFLGDWGMEVEFELRIMEDLRSEDGDRAEDS